MNEVSKNILNLLETNHPASVSGDEICKQLGLTPENLQKEFLSLKEKGYPIEPTDNNNFLLMSSPEFLKPQNIKSYLKTNFIGHDIHYFNELESDTEKAFHLAQKYPVEEESATPLRKSPPQREDIEMKFAGNGSVIVTDSCTGKHCLWSSVQIGNNFFSSVVLRPGILPSRAPQIALVSCVALARTLENTCGVRPNLRWPNVLTVDGKSLGKFKFTMQSNIEKINFLILGFEVNVNWLSNDLDDSLKNDLISLRSISGKSVNRPLFADSLFRELEKWYITYINKGPEKIIREANLYFRYDKKETEITSAGKIYSGVIEGLDTDGTLILRNNSGKTTKIPAGNISQSSINF